MLPLQKMLVNIHCIWELDWLDRRWEWIYV